MVFLSSLLFGLIVFFVRRLNLIFNPLKLKKSISLTSLFEILFFSGVYLIGYIMQNAMGLIGVNYFAIGVLLIPLLMSFDFIIKPYFITFFEKNSNQINYYESYIFENTGETIKVFEIDNNEVNIYATGILNSSKSILITKAALESLSDAEIKSLIFHELGHLKNKHLLLMYVVNCSILICYFFSALWLHPQLITLNAFWEGFLVFSHGMILGLFLFIIPGAVQKRLELQADLHAVKYQSKNDFILSLQKLNTISNGSMEKISFNYPTIYERIKNIEQS